MSRVDLSALLELPIGERVELVQTLWDSIAGQTDPYPLSDRERRLIDERLEAYRAAPDAGAPWPEVKRRLLGRR